MALAVATPGATTIPAYATLAPAPVIELRDAAGHAVHKAGVSISVAANTGTLSGTLSVSTDATGRATFSSLRLGGLVGARRLTFSTSGLSSATHDLTITTGAVALAHATSSAAQAVPVLTAVPDVPVVVVTDSGGNPEAGVAVTFSVSTNGGDIAGASQVTDATGTARLTSWTVGSEAGPHTVTATAPPVTPVTFTVDVQPGPAAAIRYVSGDGQQAVIWHRVARDPTVVVVDEYGNPTPGAPVSFEVQSGGGKVSAADVQAGATGHAMTGWSLGPEPGGNALRAVFHGVTDTIIPFAAEATPPTSPFNIDARIIGSVTVEEQSAINEAVQRWRTVILDELPSSEVIYGAGQCFPDQPAITETVDDILIYVEITPIDGVGGILGGAGPCLLRNDGNLPIMGVIELDAADVGSMAPALLDDVLLHEMGHVLGFGTLWPLTTFLVAAGTPDVAFSGPAARQGYQQLGGTQTNVPVEDTGGDGTADSHWRETVFANELMTGFLSGGGNPMTAMTIGSMHDLGYIVDYASAEDLGFVLSALRWRAPEHQLLRERKPPGPIVVMDRNGNIVSRRARP